MTTNVPALWTAWWPTAWSTRYPTAVSPCPSDLGPEHRGASARLPGCGRYRLHTFRMWNVADRDQDGRDDDDAPHDLGAAGDPNAYWRRRFFILGGGVAVLGLCAWLFPGGHPAAPRASATAQASMAALAKRGDLPPAAYGSAWPGLTPKKTAKASAAAGASHRKTGARAHPAREPEPGPDLPTTPRRAGRAARHRTSSSACSRASPATAGGRCRSSTSTRYRPRRAPAPSATGRARCRWS